MTNEQKATVLDAIRRAVKAKMEQWDAERDAETALGEDVELDTAELIENLAAGLDDPESALTIAEEDIIPAIEEMLEEDEV